MTKTFESTIKEFEKNGKRGIRTLRDMKGYFSDKKEEERILKSGKNPIIYETFVEEKSPINLGLTIMRAGKVGKEFYFTKGHIHRTGKPEFYILMEGKGKLLLQKAGKTRVIELKKGELTLIGKGEAHRIANTGKKKLKVLTVYHDNSKPDYSIKFKKRFFRK
ncbi:hypothetical protein CMI45_02520 [Candidatus Pacearchaeota archaeon]|nr:hypothetical protein [Candidatus Pacearchaeota archaeon]|tara:strand:+ start:466 stop:954 length:489 start_codon:yes stop_codon:yes gene_type:complete